MKSGFIAVLCSLRSQDRLAIHVVSRRVVVVSRRRSSRTRGIYRSHADGVGNDPRHRPTITARSANDRIETGLVHYAVTIVEQDR